MKAKILYVDSFNTTRDQRWDAGDGKVLPEGCYLEVDEREVEGDPLMACERLFEQLQAVDAPVVSQTKGTRMRSMSVGDMVVINEQRFICSPVGFEALA